jgi:Na+/phosphate symporter
VLLKKKKKSVCIAKKSMIKPEKKQKKKQKTKNKKKQKIHIHSLNRKNVWQSSLFMDIVALSSRINYNFDVEIQQKCTARNESRNNM